jgi:4-hydroxybenzoate polyprenyltransferase
MTLGVLKKTGLIVRAARPLNLLFIVVTQWLSLRELGIFQPSQEAFLFMLASVLAGAAGNMINDIKDHEGDLINKPSAVWIHVSIPLNQAMSIYRTLVFLAAFISVMVSLKAVFIIALLQFSLFIYSYRLSKIAFWGNLTISWLTAGVIPSLPLVLGMEIPRGLWLIAVVAFYLNFLRELVKDIQDMPGDRVMGRKTLPLLAGSEKTFLLVFGLITLPLAYVDLYLTGIFPWQAEILEQLRQPGHFPAFMAFLFLFHLLGIASLVTTVKKAGSKKLSAALKIMMLCGLVLWLLAGT